MDKPQFWKSKRTWGVIALGMSSIINGLWPKFPDLSVIISAILGGN